MDAVSKYKPKKDNEKKLKCYLTKGLNNNQVKALKQYGELNR